MVSVSCEMSRAIIYFFTLLIQLHNGNSANILCLFPYPGKSHQMVFEPLLLKLAERGHNVTVGSFFPLKNAPSNYRDVSFENVAKLMVESYDLGELESQSILYKIPRLGSIARQVLHLNPYRTSALSICERLINHEPLLDVLKESYDVVILENFISDCMLGLLHVFGITAPIIAVTTGSPLPWSSERIGLNDNPSYVPVICAPFGTQMSFMDRVENTLVYLLMRNWYSEIQLKEKEIIEKNFNNIPDLRELARNISLIISNTYHTLNGVRPLLPGLVTVGGMHLASISTPIPQFIQKFLNESAHGVILFSFGSRIKTKSMPKYKEQIFMKVFSKLKQRVIWKFEDSDVDGTLIGNVLKVKWIPQYDLLRHDKIIAFICHGGMLGITEAMSAGKPMIIFPIFGDQHSNAAAAAEAGVGVVLSYVDLTEEGLENALNRVMSDEMQLHTRRMSQIWHDRESAPLERAVFWTEHVMRWRATRLHSAARELPFYQLALLDVAAFIIFIIITFVIIIIYLTLKVINILKRHNKEKYKYS